MTARRRISDRQLDRAIHRARSQPALRDADILAIERYWANPKPGFVPRLDYLRAVAAGATATEGGILECGSGVTTIILAVVGERSGCKTTTLEHDQRWFDRMEALFARNGLNAVDLRLAPLASFGDNCWYDVRGMNAPPPVSLAVCDGPPGALADRGLLISAGASWLRDEVTILLDDTDRPEERGLIDEWRLQGFDLIQDHQRWVLLRRACRCD
jgi:hypothetical protein